MKPLNTTIIIFGFLLHKSNAIEEELDYNASETKNCPSPTAIGLFEKTNDPTCASFFKCAWGNGYEERCPPGKIFNPKIKYCDWPFNYDCPGSPLALRINISPDYCMAPTGTFPNPDDSDCRSFLQVLNYDQICTQGIYKQGIPSNCKI